MERNEYDLADLDDGPSPEAGGRLILAFMNIRHPALREAIIELVRRLSEADDCYPATAFAR